MAFKIARKIARQIDDEIKYVMPWVMTLPIPIIASRLKSSEYYAVLKLNKCASNYNIQVHSQCSMLHRHFDRIYIIPSQCHLLSMIATHYYRNICGSFFNTHFNDNEAGQMT